MKRPLTIAALLALALAASAAFALAAPPAGKDKEPGSAAEAKAMKECKAERGATAATVAAFNEKHGTNKNKKNAFGKCVSSKTKGGDDEDDDADADKQKSETNASKRCKLERGTTAVTIAAFNEKHGTNKNKKNAHGKCVSTLAKQK